MHGPSPVTGGWDTELGVSIWWGKEGKGRKKKKERTHIRIEWNSYKRWNESYCFMLIIIIFFLLWSFQ